MTPAMQLKAVFLPLIDDKASAHFRRKLRRAAQRTIVPSTSCLARGAPWPRARKDYSNEVTHGRKLGVLPATGSAFPINNEGTIVRVADACGSAHRCRQRVT